MFALSEDIVIRGRHGAFHSTESPTGQVAFQGSTGVLELQGRQQTVKKKVPILPPLPPKARGLARSVQHRLSQNNQALPSPRHSRPPPPP